MAESLVNVTEGSGKKLHTFNRTIGANSVEDEVNLLGEPYLASYVLNSGAGISIATANSHVFQLMAGASLNLYIRRIRIYQAAAVTAAALGLFELRRLTTAGTGGTAVNPGQVDTTDAVAGATGMTLPTVLGTESTRWWIGSSELMQTTPVGGGSSLLFDLDFDKMLRTKAIRIAAGTANGIAFKNLAAYAAGTLYYDVDFCEANF